MSPSQVTGHGDTQDFLEWSPPNQQEATERVNRFRCPLITDCHPQSLLGAGLPPSRAHLMIARLCSPTSSLPIQTGNFPAPGSSASVHDVVATPSQPPVDRDTVHQRISSGRVLVEVPEILRDPSGSQPLVLLRNPLQQLFSTGGKFAPKKTFGNVRKIFYRFQIVLLATGGQKPGMPLNTLQQPGRPPRQRLTQPKYRRCHC